MAISNELKQIREFNELKLKEFNGQITKKEMERLTQLRKFYGQPYIDRLAALDLS